MFTILVRSNYSRASRQQGHLRPKIKGLNMGGAAISLTEILACNRYVVAISYFLANSHVIYLFGGDDKCNAFTIAWLAVLHPAVHHLQTPTLRRRHLTSQTYWEGLHFRCHQRSKRHWLSHSMGKPQRLNTERLNFYWFLDCVTHHPSNSELMVPSSPESPQWPTWEFLFPVTSSGQPTLTLYVAKPNGRLDCCIGPFMLEVHPAKPNSTSH